MTEHEKLVNVLVDYYYRVDAVLDESDLDSFYDKSVARKMAITYATEILKYLK